ncbi:MAG TPA: PRC-barrel domain-containing protein, partial [Gemmatimonadaceae bacterium]|nr:PRC-barrel domain-containing protein [Gemmatimonadaceae bacterium]
MDNDRDARLTRLEDLKGFQVAEGDHDIRGWEVRTPDDRKIGKVEELIVDPAERRVRYMDVKVDRKVLGVDDDRHILVPIGAARLREDGHDVLIERLPVQGLAGAPVYDRGAITRDYETSLREYYGATAATVPADYYKNDLYDDSHLRTRKEDRAVATQAAAGNAVAADAAAGDATALPRVGDNEVTVRPNDAGGSANVGDLAMSGNGPDGGVAPTSLRRPSARVCSSPCSSACSPRSLPRGRPLHRSG